MERPDAEKINLLVKEMFDRINQVLFITNNSGDMGVKRKTQMALGKVIAELDLEILEPIYKQFPELRPPEMEEIKS
jgi:hypothetical protein